MDRVDEPTDEDEVSFAPTPSPEEARARLAALRGKPLDAPSRLVTDETLGVNSIGLPAKSSDPVEREAPTAAASDVSFTLPADKMARLLNLLDRPEASKTEPQKPASAAKKADSPLFKVKKVRITTRIDADVLEAFKAEGGRWQTRINDVLRANMPKTPEA